MNYINMCILNTLYISIKKYRISSNKTSVILFLIYARKRVLLGKQRDFNKKKSFIFFILLFN